MLTMHPVSPEAFTVQQLPSHTVVAVAAELCVVRRHLLSQLKRGNIGAERDDEATGLVTRDNRHQRAEFASVDMEVRAANPAGLDCEKSEGRHRRVGKGWEKRLPMVRVWGDKPLTSTS